MSFRPAGVPVKSENPDKLLINFKPKYLKRVYTILVDEKKIEKCKNISIVASY